jgi:2-keto-3-deoxy-L-rhamnonate aldolase RhmA
VACGIYSNDPAYVRELVGRGMQLVVIASDAVLLRSAAAARVAAWQDRAE